MFRGEKEKNKRKGKERRGGEGRGEEKPGGKEGRKENIGSPQFTLLSLILQMLGIDPVKQ